MRLDNTIFANNANLEKTSVWGAFILAITGCCRAAGGDWRGAVAEIFYIAGILSFSKTLTPNGQHKWAYFTGGIGCMALGKIIDSDTFIPTGNMSI